MTSGRISIFNLKQGITNKIHFLHCKTSISIYNINLPIQFSFHLSCHSSTQLHILSFHPPINLIIYPSICISIHSLIHLFILSFYYSSFHFSICLIINLFIHLSVIHPSIYSHILSCIIDLFIYPSPYLPLFIIIKSFIELSFNHSFMGIKGSITSKM